MRRPSRPMLPLIGQPARGEAAAARFQRSAPVVGGGLRRRLPDADAGRAGARFLVHVVVGVLQERPGQALAGEDRAQVVDTARAVSSSLHFVLDGAGGHHPPVAVHVPRQAPQLPAASEPRPSRAMAAAPQAHCPPATVSQRCPPSGASIPCRRIGTGPRFSVSPSSIAAVPVT